jgi:hypothetical protein
MGFGRFGAGSAFAFEDVYYLFIVVRRVVRDPSRGGRVRHNIEL